MATEDKEWHLDKSVPLGIIFVLVVQMAGGIWFMSALNSQVAQISRANEIQDARLDSVEKSAQNMAIAGATTTSQIAAITDTLSQIRADQRSQIQMLREILEAKK
jgi:hypothetical protein